MDRLDLRLVEYFVAVAEELHFGRAAQRLHIAQPSLSQQIRRLESQLGATLLERNSRNVRLTRAGEALLREGRRTLAQAQNAVRSTRAAAARRLVVGFYGSAGADHLPAVLRECGEQLPDLQIAVRELRLGSLNDVEDGNVDVAFTRILPGQSDLEIRVIAHEPRVVALPVSHPLAGRRSLRFSDLASESFITNPAVSEDAPRPARWLAEQHRHGLRGRVAARSTGVLEILTLVAAGRGVCLVPSSVKRHYPRPDVAYVAVTDAEPAVVSLVWRSDTVDSQVEAFVELVVGVAGPAAERHEALLPDGARAFIDVDQ
ncbi:MAG: LysR substrate-binding domain-containing protein [Solirubrobacteraceae bacterium]